MNPCTQWHEATRAHLACLILLNAQTVSDQADPFSHSVHVPLYDLAGLLHAGGERAGTRPVLLKLLHAKLDATVVRHLGVLHGVVVLLQLRDTAMEVLMPIHAINLWTPK